MPSKSEQDLLNAAEDCKNDIHVMNLGAVNKQLGLDIGCGIAYLHNQEIARCDLKSLNMLLDERNREKIIDFGLSKIKTSKMFSTLRGGSYQWMAPELFKDDDEEAKSTKATDVFSNGVVLWELGARKVPFDKKHNEAVPILVMQGKREEITKDTPPSKAKQIAKCWEQRAEARPTMDEAVKTLRDNQSKVNSSNHSSMTLQARVHGLYLCQKWLPVVVIREI